MLAVARAKLGTLAPSAPIHIVEVLSSTKVEVFYGEQDANYNFGYLAIERHGDRWQVTAVGRKAPFERNVLVTQR
jgi:hypothetical protein